MSFSLVLAGGGVTGIAWETGVLLGLRDEGVDLVSRVDRVIGTSAGSVVGAQFLGGPDLEDLFAAQVADEHHEINPDLDLDLLMRVFGLMVDGGTTTNEQRRHIGELALGATTVEESTRRRVIEHRLSGVDWPVRDLVVTAIDAHSGEFVTWTKSSGVSLIDAVASSCAVPGVWPCVTIHGRRYYDGGLRTGANALLATDSAEVVGDRSAHRRPIPCRGCRGRFPAFQRKHGSLHPIRPRDRRGRGGQLTGSRLSPSGRRTTDAVKADGPRHSSTDGRGGIVAPTFDHRVSPQPGSRVTCMGFFENRRRKAAERARAAAAQALATGSGRHRPHARGGARLSQRQDPRTIQRQLRLRLHVEKR